MTTGLAALIIAAQFVSLVGVELPFYIVVFTGGTLKLASAREACGSAAY